MNTDRYFATLERGDDYLNELCERINAWRRFLFGTGTAAKWSRQLRNYYGSSNDGTKSSNQLVRGGDQGEKVLAAQGDYRSLLRRKLSMATNQRPAGVAKAMKSDTRARHAARVGSAIAEHYLSRVGFEKAFQMAAECALAVDEGYVLIGWNNNAGREIRPDPTTGKPIMTGDGEIRPIWPWNLARDPYVDSFDSNDWFIATYRMNKWSLVADYPEYEKQIVSGGVDTQRKLIQMFVLNRQIGQQITDQRDVHVFVHKKNSAVKGGRLTIFVEDAILLDGPLPYPEIPVYPCREADVIDDPRGYSSGSDLLASEEAEQNLVSIMLSNNLAFGGQCIVSPKGAGLVPSHFAKGFTLFELDPAMIDKIRPLQLTKSSPEAMELINYFSQKKQTVSGVNEVARGNLEGGLKSASGSALALIQSQAIEANSDVTKAYYQLLSRAMTGFLKLCQKYAKSPMIAELVGRAQQDYIRSFQWTGQDLTDEQGQSLIGAIIYEPVNPLLMTMSGRDSIADKLLERGMIKNAQGYITFLMTGSFDAFIQDDESDNDLILAENERLRDGTGEHKAVVTENHARHIASHMSVLGSPEAKDDPQLVTRVLKAIFEHMDLWRQASMQSPEILIATGQQVLPMGGAPMGEAAGLPAPGPADSAAAPNPMDAPGGGGEPPAMPRPPVNPLTGEDAQIATPQEA